MKWLRHLLGLCSHQWTIHSYGTVYHHYEDIGRKPAGVVYIQRCEHCGELKKLKVMG